MTTRWSALLLFWAVFFPVAAAVVVRQSPPTAATRRDFCLGVGGGTVLGVQQGAVSPALAAPPPTTPNPTTLLSDGLTFPLVSFGLQVYDDERARRYTRLALDAGVRNFFASVLAGNQRGFGRAVRESNVPRDDIFVCGSVLSNRARGFDAAFQASARGCDANFDALGVGPLDMIMLDYPGPDDDSIRGQWAALEAMQQRGDVKSLAVSNFSPKQLDAILLSPEFKSRPTVNQLPFGVGYKPRAYETILAENEKRGVLVQAWSPLRVVGPSAKALCAEIGQSYRKSPQQVALRYILQKGAAFTMQTTSKAHFEENLALFDFSLSPDDMARLDAVEG